MKKAATLIELVFAIVIIGISLMTLPSMLSVTTKTTEMVMESRGFWHGISKVLAVTSMAWDESNVVEIDSYASYGVLNTNDASFDHPAYASELNCTVAENTLRPGHYEGNSRRSCNALNASTIQNDGEGAENYDDIDDFNGLTDGIDDNLDGNDDFFVIVDVAYIPYVFTGDTKYVKQFSTSVTAGSTTDTSSIKRVNVEVQNSGGERITTYYYYATNIGTTIPYTKLNP